MPGRATRSLIAQPALAVVVAAARARIRTFDAAVAAALLAEIARGATLLVDAREVFAVVAGGATLPVLAMVHAVPIATRAATAFAGTRRALAVVVAVATARVRTFDATVAAALVGEVARRATLPVDACLELCATRVVDAALPDCCTRESQEPESKHHDGYERYVQAGRPYIARVCWIHVVHAHQPASARGCPVSCSPSPVRAPTPLTAR